MNWDDLDWAWLPAVLAGAVIAVMVIVAWQVRADPMEFTYTNTDDRPIDGLTICTPGGCTDVVGVCEPGETCTAVGGVPMGCWVVSVSTILGEQRSTPVERMICVLDYQTRFDADHNGVVNTTDFGAFLDAYNGSE